jgi:hypothetical protein
MARPPKNVPGAQVVHRDLGKHVEHRIGRARQADAYSGPRSVDKTGAIEAFGTHSPPAVPLTHLGHGEREDGGTWLPVRARKGPRQVGTFRRPRSFYARSAGCARHRGEGPADEENGMSPTAGASPTTARHGRLSSKNHGSFRPSSPANLLTEKFFAYMSLPPKLRRLPAMRVRTSFPPSPQDMPARRSGPRSGPPWTIRKASALVGRFST